MIPFQVIDENWMHPGHNAILTVKEGKVVKKFNNKEIYEKEKKHYEVLANYTPHAEFNDEGFEVIMEKCIPLVEWLQDKNVQEKRLMAKQVLSLVKHMHHRNIYHNDFHANNIVVRSENTYDFNPLVIDFEQATKVKNKIMWWGSNDCTGEKYMGFDSNHYLSIKLILGYSAKDELIEEVRADDLLGELINTSSDAFGPKQGEGLYYGSYHHQRFNHVNAQRNTPERFKFMQIKNDDLKGKKVLDIGCACAAMSLMASIYGAREVIGLDSDTRYVNFSNKLFKFLGLNGSFKDCNVKELRVLPKSIDVIFALAVSNWIGKPHLINLISNSDAETVYFEDNAPDKDTHIDIPNYECARLGVYDGRVNYVCKRKEGILVEET